MPQSDPFEILLAHDRWATEQLLIACEKLSTEQFQQRFEIGPGSLHDTVTHMIAAMRTWTDSLAQRPPQPRIDADGQRRTIAQLREIFAEVNREFEMEARRRPLEEIVTRTMRDGKTIHLTRGAVVTHVATHGMHHRAQCLNMLRQLGIKPLPHSSVAEWIWLADGKA